jgi:hypothetical protein
VRSTYTSLARTSARRIAHEAKSRAIERDDIAQARKSAESASLRRVMRVFSCGVERHFPRSQDLALLESNLESKKPQGGQSSYFAAISPRRLRET